MDPDQIIAQLQSGAFGAASGSSSAPVANVYLGSSGKVDSKFDNKQVATDGVESDRIENKPAHDDVADVDTAAQQIYGWDDARLKKWEKLLLANGLLRPGQYNYEDLVSAWESAVKGASNLFAAGKKVTPEQYVDVYVGSKFGGKAPADDPNQSNTTYARPLDDLDARATAEDAYKTFLGRGRVSSKEAGAVKAAVNAYIEAHPSITTTHTQKDGDTVTRSTGGASEVAQKQIVEDQLKAKPGYAEHQASTTIHNWLMDAIGPATTGY